MFSNANEFAHISLHFMLDPVQPLEYETGLLGDIYKFTKMAEVDEIQFGFFWFLRSYENF